MPWKVAESPDAESFGLWAIRVCCSRRQAGAAQQARSIGSGPFMDRACCKEAGAVLEEWGVGVAAFAAYMDPSRRARSPHFFGSERQ